MRLLSEYVSDVLLVQSLPDSHMSGFSLIVSRLERKIRHAYSEHKEGRPIDFCNLNRPSATVTMAKFPHTSHTEILTHWIKSA